MWLAAPVVDRSKSHLDSLVTLDSLRVVPGRQASSLLGHCRIE